MKRILYSSICLLLCGGCASTNPMASMGSQRAKNPPSTAGLPTPSQETHSAIQQASGQQSINTSFPDTVLQHVNVGQTEVAAWYRDNDDQHLSMAKTHFEEAIRQAPNNPDAHHGLAIIADLQEQYSLAELHYQKALAINPNNGKVLGDLGYSYLLQGRLSEGESFLTRAIEVDGTNQNAIKHLGDVYAQQGRTQLAKTTYAAVLSPSESQAALAENSKPQVAQAEDKPSLFEKMLPKKKEELDPTEEIRQLMLKEREKRAEAKMLAQGSSSQNQQRMSQQPSQGYVPEYYSDEQQLKRDLANVDRERYQSTPNGPIVIDPQSGRQVPQGYLPQQSQQFNNSQQVQQGFAQQPGYGQQNFAQQGQFNPNTQQAPGSQGQPHQQMPQAYPQQQYATNTPQGHLNSSNQMGQPMGNSAPPMPALDRSQTSSPYFAQQPNAQSSMPQISPREGFQSQQNAMGQNNVPPPGQQPWAGIQPAAAESIGPVIDQAYHEQQQPSPPENARQQFATNQPSSVPPQLGMNSTGSNNQVQRTNPSDYGNTYEEASKAAARMGMGLGSGTVFPVFQQTTNRSSPGSDTRMNGTSFSAPQRFLPTDLPPQDLNQAYAPQNTPQFAPPPNSHGQQMPSSTPPMFSQEQFGTASRYTPSSLNTANAPQQPQGEGYHNGNHPSFNAQRQQVDTQLNDTIQQAWGQRPMSQNVTPAGGGNQLQAPAVYGGTMTTFNGDASQPPSWPHQTQQPQMNQQANRPYSNSYQGNSPNVNDYSPGVVVPPPYPGAVNHQPPTNNQQYAPQQGGNAPLQAPQRQLRDNSNPSPSLPMIVPGNR